MTLAENHSQLKESQEESLSILFVGDLFGKAGRKALEQHLPRLRQAYPLEMVIVNGENSAGGIGITPAIANELFQAGIDVITSGNHIWKYKEIFAYMESTNRLLRPLNYPPGAPGKGFVIYTTSNRRRVAVLNLAGRVFMDPLDCPFQAADRFLDKVRLGRDVDAIVVDMHAEASSEKGAMGYYLDGRVSAILGTHTHIPTADQQILPHGSAFQTDVGMTGCYRSVIGMKGESVMPRFLRQMPTHFEQATDEGSLCATVLTLSLKDGLCRRIQPVRLGGSLSETPLPIR
ncbi:TIGR00282 family metallophosphoesterase [Candidatus Magnetaquicoccus inordinatus]|uniref:TIGR00282 family metallophosphoesterase n=1 Tax=Candidatus Magnetaquicoccus inordinatus TaxID=2496818 RepID=UPI001D0E0CDA|nr:TIGR00282 family metallophosphoesterase [Candidatus Magnetaquicoccus inordinatus]